MYLIEDSRHCISIRTDAYRICGFENLFLPFYCNFAAVLRSEIIQRSNEIIVSDLKIERIVDKNLSAITLNISKYRDRNNQWTEFNVIRCSSINNSKINNNLKTELHIFVLRRILKSLTPPKGG